MITLPNLLSFLRLPLAFLFLFDSIPIRIIALISAAATDFLDGYLARRYNMSSRLGTTLDPMTDKFFVIFALAVLFEEGRMSLTNALAMLSRDFALLLFGVYLLVKQSWNRYQFYSIWCGKITTTLQLGVLLALILHWPIPPSIYNAFILLGFMALAELYLSQNLLRTLNK